MQVFDDSANDYASAFLKHSPLVSD